MSASDNPASTAGEEECRSVDAKVELHDYYSFNFNKIINEPIPHFKIDAILYWLTCTLRQYHFKPAGMNWCKMFLPGASPGEETMHVKFIPTIYSSRLTPKHPISLSVSSVPPPHPHLVMNQRLNTFKQNIISLPNAQGTKMLIFGEKSKCFFRSGQKQQFNKVKG